MLTDRTVQVHDGILADVAPTLLDLMEIEQPKEMTCLLYTSDAADERSSVDLGGRRIIKKNKITNHSMQRSNKQTTRMREIT